MAVIGGVEALVGGLDSLIKKALIAVFDYVLKNLRFGRPGHQEKTENFQASYVEGTTHSTADTEFSILHGRETAPYLAIPVLDLQAVGSRMPVLEVTRAADANRIYLSSPEEDIPITLYLE